MNIIEVMNSPKLFGQWFKRKLLRGDTWAAWRVFLKALSALALNENELATYTKHTGRTDVPTEQPREAWLICGRRSGKSLIAAFIAVFLACFRSYEDVLAPGEIATVMIIAADRRQARVVLGYINGFFDAIATLGRMVTSRTKESIMLSNRVRIEVHTASFRAVRGYSIAAVILDEIAFFPTGDSAEPDTEIVNALRPAMATIPKALLLGISSPYARRGVLYEAFKEHYGKAGAPAVVWKAATREMNSSVSAATIALAYERDEASATAEYGAEFRSDVERFIPLELVETAMVHKRELPPVGGVDYRAFVDPSGGQADAFTLAIAHPEKDRVVLDVLREVLPPFSPEKVVAEFCDVLRPYRCFEVTGDRYGGEWPREQFAKRGVTYKLSELTRSELYIEMLPLLTGGVAELQENPRLKSQLVSLERKTSRSGKDSVDHPPGAGSHDDCANAVAGALVLAAARAGGVLGMVEFCKELEAGKHQQLLESASPASASGERPPARGQRGEYLAERDNGWRSAASRGVFGRFGRR